MSEKASIENGRIQRYLLMILKSTVSIPIRMEYMVNLSIKSRVVVCVCVCGQYHETQQVHRHQHNLPIKNIVERQQKKSISLRINFG